MTIPAINLSALNHYTYCPRRCGLIYLEAEFEQNIHTARGNAEHERVDHAAHIAGKDGAHIDYALPIWSESMGLTGKCDVVEHWPDGTLFPVEYKHGKKQKWLNDDLQLTAQALCLEEMFNHSVPTGAIFHATSRRRRDVAFTEKLRALVTETADAVRAMLENTRLPPPVNDRRCGECSLNVLCQPAAIMAREKQRVLRQRLFDPDAPSD